jgi:hypothetical protein
LPQSTPYGHAGVKAQDYALGITAQTDKRALNGLFAESLHRGDRENMASVADYSPMYRPRWKEATAYGFHTRERFERIYSTGMTWARTTSQSMDHGIAAKEIQESEHHLAALSALRYSVMFRLLTQPGIPTHQSNLHGPPGLWIRNWSESGIMAATPSSPDKMHYWTPERASIKLESGRSLAHIPSVAPRTWFGFTNLGPMQTDIVQAGDVMPSLAESASERWVNAYLKHRKQAIRMLFNPELVNVDELIEEHTVARGKLLEKAGRIKKETATTNSAFAAAFSNLMKPNQE